ncbi:MAG: 4Fe-4S dicluster domain-containing protein [Planctomycetota bacterium]
MKPKFIASSDMTALLDALAKDRPVACCTALPEEAYLTYRAHKQGAPFAATGFRATPSIKSLIFPPREKVADYPGGTDRMPALPPPPAVIGAAACDLQALASLDAIFLEEDFVDGFYAARREALFVISQDCTAPRETCACTYVGMKPYPEKGFDLNLSPVEGGFVLEIGSPRGEALLDANAGLLREASLAELDERDQKRAAVVQAVESLNRDYALRASRRELLRKAGTESAWAEGVSTCVECAACLFACPTCNCFMLSDQMGSRGGERVKSWDACSYAGYARMAGGGTPRPFLIDRFRHRYAHKFDYFPERYGFEMCSGCGRCIEACAGKIDMRKVFKALETA